MAQTYVLQQGALGDVLILECVTTLGQAATVPLGATYTMTFTDPTGSTSTQAAILIQPNLLSFTTSQAFNFSTAGTWTAQGLITIGTSVISKTQVQQFSVLPSLS